MLPQTMPTTTRLLLLLGALLLVASVVHLVSKGGLPEATTDIAKKDVVRIALAAEPYLARHGHFPQSVGILEGSLRDKDPWDTPYRITCCPGGEVLVLSAGPDLTFETPDDLSSRTYDSPPPEPLPPCSTVESAD